MFSKETYVLSKVRWHRIIISLSITHACGLGNSSEARDWISALTCKRSFLSLSPKPSQLHLFSVPDRELDCSL